MSADHTPERGMHGIEAVRHFLDRERAPYELIEHTETFAAADETGALPPFSSLLGTPEILDTRLLAHDHVLCSAGDHRHTLKVSPREIERLGEPLVADTCQAHRALTGSTPAGSTLDARPGSRTRPRTSWPAATNARAVA